MNRTSIALIAALLTTVSGCASEIEYDEESGEHESGLAGAADNERGEKAVVGILWKDAQGVNKICTGELVAPKVVLTAAHCVVSAVSSTVFVGTSYAARKEAANGAKHIAHPSFAIPVKDPAVGANDIGAIVLATPLTTKPLALNREALEGIKGIKGETVTLVGFGVTARTAPSTAGIKRSGDAILSEVRKNEIYVTGGPDLASACGGDSGGPALLRTKSGYSVIGVESRGDTDCKVGTFKTRVDKYLPFIDDIIAKNK